MLAGNALLSTRRSGFGWLRRLARAMEGKWLGGSVVAWVAFAVSLVGSAIVYGATVATIQGQIATLNYTVTRNREESLDRVRAVEASVSNVYTSLITLSSIKVDVEVIKEQIKSINGAVQRMEVDTRRRGTQR